MDKNEYEYHDGLIVYPRPEAKHLDSMFKGTISQTCKACGFDCSVTVGPCLAGAAYDDADNARRRHEQVCAALFVGEDYSPDREDPRDERMGVRLVVAYYAKGGATVELRIVELGKELLRPSFVVGVVDFDGFRYSVNEEAFYLFLQERKMVDERDNEYSSTEEFIKKALLESGKETK